MCLESDPGVIRSVGLAFFLVVFLLLIKTDKNPAGLNVLLLLGHCLKIKNSCYPTVVLIVLSVFGCFY